MGRKEQNWKSKGSLKLKMGILKRFLLSFCGTKTLFKKVKWQCFTFSRVEYFCFISQLYFCPFNNIPGWIPAYLNSDLALSRIDVRLAKMHTHEDFLMDIQGRFSTRLFQSPRLPLSHGKTTMVASCYQPAGKFCSRRQFRCDLDALCQSTLLWRDSNTLDHLVYNP